MSAQVYKIGELSKLCKIPVKTLRYYDSLGLLVPDRIDRFTGYRYYSASRLGDCYRIIALKELGFTLEEIKQRTQADSASSIIALLEAKQEEMENMLLLTESRLNRLKAIKDMMSEEGDGMFDLVFRRGDILRVAELRKIYATRADAYKEIEAMKSRLPQNLPGRRAVVINYETEYRDSQFDLGACIELAASLPKGLPYTDKVISLPTNTAVLASKRNELDKAYSAMSRLVEEANCQIIGPYYEIYYDDGTVELKVPVCRLSPQADMTCTDEITLPFTDDPEAVGKWRFLDAVPSEEQFRFGHEKSSQGVWLMDLYFLPGGEGYWAIGSWTKGWLFTHTGNPEQFFSNRYSIQMHQGKKLLFLYMKENDYAPRGGMPTVWVYEQVSDQAFASQDIRICDATDYPFLPDEEVVGLWTVYDFVLKRSDFDAARPSFPKEKLYFKQIEFLREGRAIAVYGQKEPYELTWTKGLLLDANQQIAEAYERCRIGNADYLFIEWKSGDYTFGGDLPYWYVMTKANPFPAHDSLRERQLL